MERPGPQQAQDRLQPRRRRPPALACRGLHHGHDVQDLLQKILQKLEAPAKTRPSGEATGSQSPSFVADAEVQKCKDADSPQDQQATLNKLRDLGRGDWMASVQEFSTIIACWGEIMGKPGSNTSFRDPEVASMVAEAGDILGKCKTIAKSIKLVRPTRSLSSNPELLVPPPRETSDIMANLYFESFESTHRILHVPSFWIDYGRYWDSPDSATPTLRLTILLVIAIGSSLSDYVTPEAKLRNAELVRHWTFAAENWLAGPLEKDRVDLTGLQIYCLTLLARQVFSIGGDTVWMSTGSLIHRAMQIGLHRDPRNLPVKFMSVLQAEVRRRLWATILELVVQASLDSRMPPRISLDEFNTQPPSNVDDDGMDESTAVITSHNSAHFTSTSIQLALLSCLPVRLEILNVLNRIDAGTSYQHVLDLSSRLTGAFHMNHTLTKSSQRSTSFHRNLLDYLVHRFVIPLHLHFSNQARLNPIYYHSLNLSVDTATAIMAPEPDAYFSKLMASGGGLFREGLRVATMATGLELLIHVQAQCLDGTLHRTSQYRNQLKQGICDMMSLSEERIRQGETNVKTHMLLNMILGQVEALEADTPVELQVARRTRDSLVHCCNVLSSRADRTTFVSTTGSGPAPGEIEVGRGIDDNIVELDWESFFPKQVYFGGMAS
ncbi:hypothetical protein B0J13DRAFT_581923 [Dactylonectria estremocensis]|uniref:Xylanolytic transcriptional activator regulatory domain-containing protein n=1 Tax=Dactylonectria estremocensis TaxID=1079267 RepID=A0A9P9FCP4_9HYPO|nr:hypothetical protein B0J13DRAFT_581923 [Dactylonectria estremocensis]